MLEFCTVRVQNRFVFHCTLHRQIRAEFEIMFYRMASTKTAVFLLSSVAVAVMALPTRNSTGSSTSYCYGKDPKPYLRFGSMEAYEPKHGDLSKIQSPKDCEPLQFWTLNRHGTRYSSEKEIGRFRDLLEVQKKVGENFRNGKTELCADDVNLIQSWKWNITESKAKELTTQGFSDLKGIAERFKKRYPSLFTAKYSPENYYFQHTPTERTKSSYKAYIFGLFGADSQAQAKESNDVIGEFKQCEKWQKEAHSNATRREYTIFGNLPEYDELRKRVSQRLGFDEVLDKKTVEAMFLDCAYETAWNLQERSKWCAAFTKKDLELLEYGGDLLTYYKNAYGNKYSVQLGCPTLKHLLEYTEKKIKDSAVHQPKVTALFTHSTAFDQFLVALDANKDDTPLTAENYEQMKDRKWRVSKFGMFATNIATILYKCSSGNEPYQIQFLIDEKPFSPVRDCVSGLCPWKSIKDSYSKRVSACNLNFCKNSS